MTNKKYLQLAAFIIGILVLGIIAWLVVNPTSGPSPYLSVPQQRNASTTSTRVPSVKPTYTASPVSESKITIVSPAQNDQWILGNRNTIQWSRAAGAIDGTISLLNASTGVVVGWIQQHISPQQMIFPWNTGDVFISPTSALREDVPTGNYRIALTFNSPDIPSVTSPVFSIISPAEAQIPTASIVIQDASFSSSSMTVARGTKLIFVNRDTISYGLSVTSNGIFAIGSSTSRIFDTSILLPSTTYVFYSTAYPSLRLMVIVENKTS